MFGERELYKWVRAPKVTWLHVNQFGQCDWTHDNVNKRVIGITTGSCLEDTDSPHPVLQRIAEQYQKTKTISNSYKTKARISKTHKPDDITHRPNQSVDRLCSQDTVIWFWSVAADLSNHFDWLFLSLTSMGQALPSLCTDLPGSSDLPPWGRGQEGHPQPWELQGLEGLGDLPWWPSVQQSPGEP